ncbi:MAG: type II secretion system protein [Minisyncoccia bacterium]
MSQARMRKDMRAFTLVETMVVIAILGIVSIAFTNMIVYTYRTNAFIFQQTSATDNARRGIEYALENIREASYGADGAYPIAAAATSTVTFYADVDSDGTVEKIRYYLTDKKLYRGVINPVGSPPSYAGQTETTIIAADYVQNGTSTPLFHYYDDAGAELSSPFDVSNIASVSAVIGVDVDPNRAPVTFTLIGQATLRNVRHND